MLPRTRPIPKKNTPLGCLPQWRNGLILLAIMLGAGCGGDPMAGKSMTAGTVADDSRDAADVSPHGPTPSPSVLVVTIHVKDMGAKLNLL